MKPKTRKTVIITAGVALLAIIGGFTAIAAGPGQRWAHDPEKVKKFVHWRVNDILDDVDATDNQREAFTQATDAILAEMIQLKGKHRADHDAVLQELSQPEPDPQKIQQLLDQRMAEFQKVAHQAIAEGMEAFLTLTPEQRELFLEKLPSGPGCGHH